MGMIKTGRLKNEKGFTLVEIAIVLVVIGILIGAVLKGQELINSSKIKKIYNLQQEMTAAIFTYQDRYGQYPGDDNSASGRWTGVPNGNANGNLGGTSYTCAAATTTETCIAWRHLRNSNLITGSASSAVNPKNPFGGSIGFGTQTIQGLNTTWISFRTIPYDACQILDQKYDDGAYNSGTVRGSGNYDSATSGSYNIYFKL